ncbi:gliding motility-associated C-terminal domain-containing protein [Flavobacterium sp. 3HN19-14]|uniref:Ig-like domain-containing protein n=1 Tax=Flavobacterium sp. 3HN19-14 TaxID=3448133 RepID=UPI003EE2089C
MAITISISDPAAPTTNDATQEFCAASNPTVANLQVNESNVVVYATATGGSALPSSTLLTNGTTYYVSQIINACESSVRLAITVTLSTNGTPTTNDATQNFCTAQNATVADIQVNEPDVEFFTTASGGAALATTTPLTNGIYYAAFSTASGCSGVTRLEITVTIGNPATPTTTDATQDFCTSDNPTVADLQVNEPNVIFYVSPTGGTALASTTSLSNGIYYAAISENGCESSTRLAITVSLTSPATPTTNDNSQNFCQANNPTIADIQVNETGVIFYDAATGGNALDPTIALVNGATYYVSQIVNGCESSTRLAISVTFGTPSTPTTGDDTQSFCKIDNPTVANLQVNESGVQFFTTASGGTALASTNALVSGNYYAAFDGTNNCPSATRLLIAVTVNDAATPTTNDNTQDFCTTSNPTIANIQTNQPNVIFYTAATGGSALVSSTPLTSGTYYAALLDPVSGCQSSIRLAITVTVNNGGTPAITGGDGDACIGESVTYTTNPGKTNYVYTVVNGTVTAGGTTTDNTITISWTNNGVGTVTVVYTDSCSNTNTAIATVNVTTCSDITITKTVDNPTPSVNDNVVFTITVSNVGSGQFTDLVVTDVLPSGYAFVSSNASIGSYSNITGIWNIPQLNANQTATLAITVKVLPTGDYLNTTSIISSNPPDSDPGNNHAEVTTDPLCLIVYNEFSPNGDGSNETFRIDCIENYPNNSIEIYNRYGVLVYTKKQYMNDWDGTPNVGTFGRQDKLPSGTYYFILNTGVDGIVKQGWVYLAR